MKNKFKRKSGITLVSLVLTIIILLILSTVAIQSLTHTGMFKRAQEAKDKMENAKKDEQIILGQYIDELNKQTQNEKYDKTKGVNKPELMQGMKAVKFTEPKGDTEGTVEQITDSTSTAWYDYNAKKWANAQTEDGSMWVWIPRYAYKIHKENGIDTQRFDIVFLIGTTDNYYDENGEIQTAQRQSSEDEIIRTNGELYTVHPAFTNESSINYANGGWDKELLGIWVAKFAAGYASGNNNTPVKASSINYTDKTAWVGASELGTKQSAMAVARNWLDGEYAVKNGVNYEWKEGEETTIKYPTFQGISYAMVYTNINDSFRISRKLTENGNIYGLNADNTDSHLMKNSEWGAVAYLSQSKYGLNGINIVINNVSLSNNIKSVYGITGCSADKEDSSAITTTIDAINNRTQKDIYVWKQEKGTQSSTTGTIYGIYDFSCGTWERVAAFVNNGHSYLNEYASSIMELLKDNKGSKYVNIYPFDDSKDNKSITNNSDNLNKAIVANYAKNTKIYGDGIRKTSTAGIGQTSWYSDFSYFGGLYRPFIERGGYYNDSKEGTGLFSFYGNNGVSHFFGRFRSVLVSL